MEIIKDTIQNVFQEWTKRRCWSKQRNPRAWLQNILTKKELGHIKVNYFRRGILGVNVDSSAWLYYLSLKKDTLLAHLQTKSRAVKEIRFYVGGRQ